MIDAVICMLRKLVNINKVACITMLDCMRAADLTLEKVRGSDCVDKRNL